ncbi:MAG: hypothetical protein WCJ22_02855 [Actinomycetes bacterium]
MKRAVYHRRQRISARPAVQVTLAVLAVALLPKPIEMIARSDVLFAIIIYTLLASAAAFAIWAWPVKK